MTTEEAGSAPAPLAILNVLWRGKFIILAGLLIGLGLGWYYANYVAEPVYRASSVVMMESREQTVVNLDSVVGGLPSADQSVLNSEAEVIRSRGLLGKVVDDLDLTSDPEFNVYLRPIGWKTKLKQNIMALFGADIEERTLPPMEVQRSDTISMLRNAINVRNISASLVFNITVETESAEKSAVLANRTAEIYILNQLDVKYDASRQATSWLADRVAELQSDLESADAKVKQFRSETELVNADGLLLREQQLKDLRDRIENSTRGIETAEAKIAAMQAASEYPEKAQAAGDVQLQQFLPRIDQPTIQTAFDNRYETLMARARTDIERLTTQRETLSSALQELEGQIQTQGRDLTELQQLTREAEASRLLYEHFLTRLKETSAQEGIQQADSRILSEAVTPKSPSAPNVQLIMAMNAILGTIAGVGIVLLLELRNNSYRTASLLEAGTGYPVLGQIPSLPIRQRRNAITYLADKPTSAAAEAVRNLRTSILLSNIDSPPQVLMTCSSLPGEGKTTMALALTQNLVGLGKKVLLVEGDIRRRVMTQYVKRQKPAGLVSVLSGKTDLETTVTYDELLQADVLLGEETAVNGADLFSSEAFAAFVRRARELYDYVIIDTPPVLVVPDARIIAQQADAVVFVVKWDSTTKTQVRESLTMFERVNCPVSGLVLNNISARGMKRYGYGGNYGAYAAYGNKYYIN
ncbi:MAG: polysaccharide biosynthesis tyrosine autokinase [Kangiellaceae bacterium]|nr:polysaccharide biosynthesis tyrosine autokinase [Kangiellaceae bacterium]